MINSPHRVPHYRPPPEASPPPSPETTSVPRPVSVVRDQSAGKKFYAATTPLLKRKGVLGRIFEACRRAFTSIRTERSRALFEDSKELVQSTPTLIEFEGEKVDISAALLLPPNLQKEDLLKNSKIRPKLTEYLGELRADRASGGGAEVPSIAYSTVGMSPFSRDADGHLIPNTVTNTNHKNSQSPFNLYVGRVAGQPLIRSGAIQTQGQAKAIVQAVNDLGVDKTKPVRVIVNQHNSFERMGGSEGKLVRNEHKQFAALNAEGNKEIEFAHINTPTNCFYEYTQYFKQFLPEAWVDRVFRGEKKSKLQNTESLALVTRWVLEDLGSSEGVEERAARLLDYQRTVDRLQAALLKSPPEGRRELHRNIDKYRQLITLEQERVYYDLDAYLKSKPLISKELEQKLQLMQDLLGNQLGKSRLSRSRELLTLKLLTTRLGAVEMVNCKSGTDRTGLSCALTAALAEMDDPYEMVRSWDAGPNSKDQEFLRNRVLFHLVNMSLPITFYSTGILGLKWHKGYQAQITPLHFLPRSVKIDGVDTPLVNTDEKGNPTGLTKVGERLLTRFSSLRGA